MDYISSITKWINLGMFSKCIACEYVYDNSVHPFIQICDKGCHLCAVCINKMRGVDFYITCPNKTCRGSFNRKVVKEIQLENKNNVLKPILENKSKGGKHENESIGKENKLEKENIPKIIFYNNEDKNLINNSNPFGNSQPLTPIESDPTNSNTSFKKQIEDFKFDNTRNLTSEASFVMSKPEECNAAGKTSDASIISKFSNTSKVLPKTTACPHCKLQVNLTYQNNLISCMSIYCKNKKYFCKLCFEVIVDPVKDKVTHFTRGIYGSQCINFDGKIKKIN